MKSTGPLGQSAFSLRLIYHLRKNGIALTVLFLSSILLIALPAGCDQEKKRTNIKPMKSSQATSQETAKALKALTRHQYLFAHHSVGENILEGLSELASAAENDIIIANIKSGSALFKANLIEFSPGENTAPTSKIDAYVETLCNWDKGVAQPVALLKFCYVDIVPQTDIQELITYYKKSIDALRRKRPDITLGHVTTPLTTRPKTLSARIKRLLGFQVWGDMANVQRARFNALLLATFPDDPIFDLATIESTRPDKSRVSFLYKGNTYHSLAPAYTDDGGHLNGLGRSVVAAKFAVFLASLNPTNALSKQSPAPFKVTPQSTPSEP